MALQALYDEDTIARRLSFSDDDDDDDMDAWACYSYIDDFMIQVHAARAVTDPYTLTYEQAMITNLDERDQWRIAAENEIKQLVENNTWVEVPLASAETKILPPVTWVFRRKRTPDGTIKNTKVVCVSEVILEPKITMLEKLQLTHQLRPFRQSACSSYFACPLDGSPTPLTSVTLLSKPNLPSLFGFTYLVASRQTVQSECVSNYKVVYMVSPLHRICGLKYYLQRSTNLDSSPVILTRAFY
eukprot:scaffold122485_cov31-Attheya_sp.AAC.1